MFARSLALALGAAAFAAPFPEPHNNQKETIPLLTSADALTKLHLPEGFKATLFAAEPDVRQSCTLCHRVSLHLLCEPPGAIALVSVCPSPPACFAPSSITLIRLLNEW
jgi:hypothetical protein